MRIVERHEGGLVEVVREREFGRQTVVGATHLIVADAVALVVELHVFVAQTQLERQGIPVLLPCGERCTIGLAALGYPVTASDISDGELVEAKARAESQGVSIRFEHADFCALTDTFSEQFDIVIAMDNALPHMLTGEALETAVRSITGQIKQGGIFVASIRDYDSLLDSKPPYSPPYIHKTEKGQRVSFQTWVWNGDNYQLTQYIIDDEENLQIGKFVCEYRATRREELTNLLLSSGCSQVIWKFPEESGFYQPIVIARK